MLSSVVCSGITTICALDDCSWLMKCISRPVAAKSGCFKVGLEINHGEEVDEKMRIRIIPLMVQATCVSTQPTTKGTRTLCALEQLRRHVYGP